MMKSNKFPDEYATVQVKHIRIFHCNLLFPKWLFYEKVKFNLYFPYNCFFEFCSIYTISGWCKFTGFPYSFSQDSGLNPSVCECFDVYFQADVGQFSHFKNSGQ